MRVASVRIKKYFLAPGFLIAAILNATAQTKETGTSHTLLSGAGTLSLTDHRLSLSSEKLDSRSLAYSFTSSNVSRKKRIVAGFEKGIGNSGNNRVASNEFMLQYVNAFSVLKDRNNRWNNYTGYSFIVNPQYIKSADQYSWAMSGSLTFYNSFVYSWKKSAVIFDLTIPVAGLGSRPGPGISSKGTVNDMLYNSFSNVSFTSLHNFRMANASLGYSTAVSKRISFTARALYSYKKVSFNTDFLRQAYSVQAGLSYRIK